MPIDANDTIKKISQYAFGSPFLNNILSNSVYVAITIAVVMILLIAIMYPAKRGTSVMVLCRMFIYMFGISLVVIFLHDSVTKYMMKEEYQDGRTNDFLRGAYEPNPIMMKKYKAEDMLKKQSISGGSVGSVGGMGSGGIGGGGGVGSVGGMGSGGIGGGGGVGNVGNVGSIGGGSVGNVGNVGSIGGGSVGSKEDDIPEALSNLEEKIYGGAPPKKPINPYA